MFDSYCQWISYCHFIFFSNCQKVSTHFVKVLLAAQAPLVNTGGMYCSLAPHITGLCKGYRYFAQLVAGQVSVGLLQKGCVKIPEAAATRTDLLLHAYQLR